MQIAETDRSKRSRGKRSIEEDVYRKKNSKRIRKSDLGRGTLSNRRPCPYVSNNEENSMMHLKRI
jgi:hypothetical protein